MRRLLIAVCIAAASNAAAAVTVARGDRVAVLRADTLERVQQNLVVELRSLGIDAFDAGDVSRPSGARYVVELRPAGVRQSMVPVDAVATSSTTGVLVARPGTSFDLEIRLYDGESFELVRTWELHESVSAGPAIGKWWLAPFSRAAASRPAARAAAREAALKIANVNQIE